MPLRPDDRRMAAWRSLLEVHAAVVEILERELERERGLPLNRYEVLLQLDQAPDGRMRMQELARSVLLSKSGLSRLVDRMVDAGLVRRQRCPNDGRGAFAVVTDLGRQVLRAAAPVHLRGIRDHFAAHLDDAEAETISRSLSRVARAARAAGSLVEPSGERSWAP